MSTKKPNHVSDREHDLNERAARLRDAEMALQEERAAFERLKERASPVSKHRAMLQDLYRELGEILARREPEVMGIFFVVQFTDGKVYPHGVHDTGCGFGNMKIAIDKQIDDAYALCQYTPWMQRAMDRETLMEGI